MKVAVVKTGPGVTWPMAMASRSWAFRHPVPPLDEVRPEESQEHVAAPEEDRADLEEEEKHRPQTERSRCRPAGESRRLGGEGDWSGREGRERGSSCVPAANGVDDQRR